MPGIISSSRSWKLHLVLLGCWSVCSNAFIPAMPLVSDAMGSKMVTSSLSSSGSILTNANKIGRSNGGVAVGSSATAVNEAIKEGELTENDKIAPPSTFFECTLQVSGKVVRDCQSPYHTQVSLTPPY